MSRRRAGAWVDVAEETLLRGLALLEARMQSTDDPPSLPELSKALGDLAARVTTHRAVVVGDERDAPPRRPRKPRAPRTRERPSD